MNNIRTKKIIDDPKIKTPNKITLRQLVHWLSLGARPVPKEYEDSLNRPKDIYPTNASDSQIELIDIAKAFIFRNLKEGSLKAEGIFIRCRVLVMSEYEISQGSSPFRYDDEPPVDFENVPEDVWSEIPQCDWNWDNLNWERETIHKNQYNHDKYFSIRYGEIRFLLEDISALNFLDISKQETNTKSTNHNSNDDPVLKIKYSDHTREIILCNLITGARRKMKTLASDTKSENRLVFSFLYNNPQKHYEATELYDLIPNYSLGSKGESYSKMLDSMGFRGDLKKLFFPSITKDSLMFVNPITKKIIDEVNIDIKTIN